jgi:hypothetical protein
MGLEPPRPLNDPANGGDLIRRNNPGPAARPPHDADQSWGTQDLQLPVHPAMNENVRGEQGQQESFGAIPPTVRGFVNGKKYAMALAQKGFGDGFLMLVTSV